MHFSAECFHRQVATFVNICEPLSSHVIRGDGNLFMGPCNLMQSAVYNTADREVRSSLISVNSLEAVDQCTMTHCIMHDAAKQLAKQLHFNQHTS